VVALVGLLAAIAIPNLVRARSAQQKACIENLRQLDGANLKNS
jgi:type II secretory pathway pseudopilin PulG